MVTNITFISLKIFLKQKMSKFKVRFPYRRFVNLQGRARRHFVGQNKAAGIAVV